MDKSKQSIVDRIIKEKIEQLVLPKPQEFGDLGLYLNKVIYHDVKFDRDGGDYPYRAYSTPKSWQHDLERYLNYWVKITNLRINFFNEKDAIKRIIDVIVYNKPLKSGEHIDDWYHQYTETIGHLSLDTVYDAENRNFKNKKILQRRGFYGHIEISTEGDIATFVYLPEKLAGVTREFNKSYNSMNNILEKFKRIK